MATSKQYAWYLEGNQIAIVEKDVSFDNNLNNKDYGPGSTKARWESPQSSITDGLEVKYVYSPKYRIHEYTDNDSNLGVYYSSAVGKESYDGKLFLADSTSSYTDYSSLLSVGSYFVLTNAGKWNGLHKVLALTNYLSGTNNAIITDTSAGFTLEHSGGIHAFEESPNLYYNISVLEDESFDLDLPVYLQKALVYYIKAKLAEDAGNLKLREFLMREFKKMIEKHDNSRISGLRIISPGSHAIR
tara:strand:- start:82 stop:813 length:732 start_codon:yes stop_codon:yes gene_type:complete